MNDTVIRVMEETNNYFATLCERVTGAHVDSKTVKAKFKGKYAAGDLLRIHGAYTLSYGDFRAGEVYEVVSFDGETLTLDKPIHTKASNLFIAYLEPTTFFLSLCERIEEYNAKAKGRDGLASESIGGYSWSAGADGTGWRGVFDKDLREYRIPNATPLYYARWAQPWQ